MGITQRDQGICGWSEGEGGEISKRKRKRRRTDMYTAEEKLACNTSQVAKASRSKGQYLRQ